MHIAISELSLLIELQEYCDRIAENIFVSRLNRLKRSEIYLKLNKFQTFFVIKRAQKPYF